MWQINTVLMVCLYVKLDGFFGVGPQVAALKLGSGTPPLERRVPFPTHSDTILRGANVARGGVRSGLGNGTPIGDALKLNQKLRPSDGEPLSDLTHCGILAAIDVIGDSTISGIFYFIGFGFFCIESLLSLWVIQQVYMYFRGSGKAAELKRDAARGALRSAF